MKKRMSMARRKMSHVIDELYTALFLMGGKEVALRIVKEEDGLRLRIRGDFAPEHQKHAEGLKELLCPAVRNPDGTSIPATASWPWWAKCWTARRSLWGRDRWRCPCTWRFDGFFQRWEKSIVFLLKMMYTK